MGVLESDETSHFLHFKTPVIANEVKQSPWIHTTKQPAFKGIASPVIQARNDMRFGAGKAFSSYFPNLCSLFFN